MMRFRLPVTLLLAISIVACNKEDSTASEGLVKHVITAGIAQGTKAEINSSDNTEVLWSPNEKVDVWASGSKYEFTGKNDISVGETTFEGKAPADMRNWVLVSPQGASSSASEATLPSVQTAVAGSFDPAAAIIAGYGTGNNVTCKNLYSGIRFKTGRAGVTAVTLKGNNNENIAGDFSFSISGASPSISGGTEKTITLIAPDGGTFNADNWYYILSLPCSFTNGVTLTAYAGSQIGTLSSSNSFSRGQLREVTSLKNQMTWETGVYYGEQNTFCTSVGTTVNIDVTPRLIGANWHRTNEIAPSGAPISAVTLWGDAIVESPLSGTTLKVSSSTEGSSLIAVRDADGTILWSFLIWVKDTITETNLSNGKTFQETLGGQLYFQWGRKDPIKKDYSFVNNREDGTDNTNLDFSIQHPDTYVFAGTYYYDWYTNIDGYQDTELWGGTEGSKTVWDPCPAGWRVPKETGFSGLKADDSSSFGQYGYISESGNSDKADEVYGETTAWCWIREKADIISQSKQSKSFVITTESTSIKYNYRYLALPVRCVKE